MQPEQVQAVEDNIGSQSDRSHPATGSSLLLDSSPLGESSSLSPGSSFPSWGDGWVKGQEGYVIHCAGGPRKMEAWQKIWDC